MRIGLLIYGSLDTLSGGYLYDRKLVEHLRNVGDEVEVVSLPWRNYAFHLTDNFSIPLLRRLKRARFEVLLQDELNHPSLFRFNKTLRKRVRYPIVSIVHHLRSSELRPAWQNILYRIPERAYLGSVDGFVFNSETTRGVVERTLGRSRPHVVAYPAGDRLNPEIYDSDIATRARQNEVFKIVFLGSVISRKNLHTLLNALALIQENWSLNVIGNLDVEPAYVKRIQEQVVQLSLGEKVSFAGALNDGPLKAALKESHLLALPSSYEGFGIAYLEGMGYGLPAIGSTDGAAHEIITHGEDGFLVGPNDVEMLSAHIRELMSDRKKLLRMSFAARERYLAHPTWRDNARKTREFLARLRDRRL